jgi:hypothetical protein
VGCCCLFSTLGLLRLSLRLLDSASLSFLDDSFLGVLLGAGAPYSYGARCCSRAASCFWHWPLPLTEWSSSFRLEQLLIRVRRLRNFMSTVWKKMPLPRSVIEALGNGCRVLQLCGSFTCCRDLQCVWNLRRNGSPSTFYFFMGF